MNENGFNSQSEAIRLLEKKRKQVMTGIIICCCSVLFMLLPPVFFCVVLFGAITTVKANKQLKELYKEAFVREPLNRNFENVFYDPNQGFSKDTVKDFRICSMGNRFSSEDYVRATYQNVNFEVADVTVADESGDDKSSSTTLYFKGRMITFDFPSQLASSVRIFSEKFKYRGVKIREAKQEKIELESVDFNKAFDVYSENPHDAFYLITPQFMERLRGLSEKYKSIAMRVSGHKVYVAFNEPDNNAFDAKVSVGKVNYEEEIAKIQSDIDDIKLFISNILNLPMQTGMNSYQRN